MNINVNWSFKEHFEMENSGVKNCGNVSFDFGRSHVKNIVKLSHVSKQYSIKRRWKVFCEQAEKEVKSSFA